MIHLIAKLTSTKDAAVILCSKENLERNKLNSNLSTKILAHIKGLKENRQFAAESGQIFPLSVEKKIVLLVGVGKEADLSLTELRIIVRKALLSSFLKKSSEVEVLPHSTDEKVVKAVIEGIVLGTYSWKKYLSDKKSSVQKKYFLVAQNNKDHSQAVTVCDGVTLARDLVNDNADVVTSELLEATIKGLIKGASNVDIEILNEKEMKAKGLNLHLAVNQGSDKEPKLIIVKYSGAGKNEPYTALIGKGITFDTGGLNLKPTGSIETMRCDMSGTAAVIGTLKNTLALKPKVNALFVTVIAENAIDSRAFKPGDVFVGYAGKSVEIGNTDAEGRLVLADAISYVVKNYKPARLIDIATLTGACVIALGHDYTGLVSTDDKLAKELINISKETDDRVWRLPSYPEIKDYVKSPIADIKNVGLPRGAAGTLTAAEFLRQFTNNTPWAHLDIAGTAFADKGRFYFDYGATGAGVRLLTHYLLNQ